jgi:very-short-patch-repair endonuclease
MREFPASLGVVARRQHGLFTREQAYERGLTKGAIEALQSCRFIRRVERGVFQLVGAPRGPEAEVLRHVLTAGAPAAASHRSAAELWGIEGFKAPAPELTVPRGRRLRRKGAIVHESTDLDRTDIVVRSGVPTTDLPRTILDRARTTDDAALALAVQWCRRERRLTWAQLAAALRRHARPGRPGIRRLRRVIAAEAHRSEVSDSTLEDLMLALIQEDGLPEPTLHHRLHLDGRDYVVDLAYVALKIAIELDGGVHMQPATFREDRRRQNAIVLDGWLILRFTWDDFRSRPDHIVRAIRAAIATRAAA